MRVYFKGVPVASEAVTWDLLCSIYTFVDHSEDMHIKEFSKEIQKMRDEAPRRILRDLGC